MRLEWCVGGGPLKMDFFKGALSVSICYSPLSLVGVGESNHFIDTITHRSHKSLRFIANEKRQTSGRARKVQRYVQRGAERHAIEHGKVHHTP